jgi:hypothetical protein
MKKAKKEHVSIKIRKDILMMGAGALCVLALLAGVFAVGMTIGKKAKEDGALKDKLMKSYQQTVTPTPTPTATPTPTPTPVPQKAQAPASVGCAQFNPANGPVSVRVNLIPDSGTITGKTVVRVKPTGSCPGESAAIENWMNEGDRSWTSPGVNPGRYRIEVANGNYDGVVAENVDLPHAGVYEVNITIHGQ